MRNLSLREMAASMTIFVICLILNMTFRDRPAFYAFIQNNGVMSISCIVMLGCVVAFLTYQLRNVRDRK